MKPKVLIFSGYGLNCEEETAYAFTVAGAATEIVHINDLIKGDKKLDSYQITAFPGGFSYGDDTGSGNAFAARVGAALWEPLKKFIARDTLTIGVCNGCQIIANLGLVPGLEGKYGDKRVAFLNNEFPRYVDRWVDLKVQKTSSPWLKGLDTLLMPIAHGEGRFYTEAETLNRMKEQNQIALKYVKGDICEYESLPHNPNGSAEDIAGITDETGRILALMPHPERSVFFHQTPNWPLVKEQLQRKGKKIPEYTSSLQIFKNAVRYFK